MSFITIGTNHKYSPVDFREKLFFHKGKLAEALLELKRRNSIRGAVILSTCNRTEIYASCDDAYTGINELKDFVSEYKDIEADVVSRNLYSYEGKRAIEHLCEVSSGLDSLVIGELQITYQVKTALRKALETGSLDREITDIFGFALAVAGKVHAETGLSKGKMSVGSVAVDLIKEKVGDLTGKNILVIGVGKITSLVLKYLGDSGSSVVFVANRTYERAKKLAENINAEAIRFDVLKEYLPKADIVITATASSHFIIKEETVDKRFKELFIFDLAMPRDVAPGVSILEGVTLFSLMDLCLIIDRNRDRRISQVEIAAKLINKEVDGSWERYTKSEQEAALLL